MKPRVSSQKILFLKSSHWRPSTQYLRHHYIKPFPVKSKNFSYRGATLQDLFQTVLQYRPKRLNTVTIIAGFNDNRLHPREVEQKWKNLINLNTNKFQPKTLIIPKTIQNSNNNDVNCKLYIHNHVLFNFIRKNSSTTHTHCFAKS